MREGPDDVTTLIRRAKSYDQLAFSELYRRTVGPVFRYLSARVNRVEEAEEITQDVFVAALNGIQGLRAEDEAGLLSWLFQIARNKLADRLRQRYRQPLLPLDEADELPDEQLQPEQAAAMREDQAEVREALAGLTAEQREVIVCKYVLGYDNSRTAKIVGKNVNAVNQLHHRALASLHRFLSRPEKVT